MRQTLRQAPIRLAREVVVRGVPPPSPSLRRRASVRLANQAIARPPRGRRGQAFSLLEVILALTILGVSLAVLGELARWGLRHAAYSRDMTQAQLLCESKMAEIVAGISWPEPAASVPFAAEDLLDPNDPVGWVYTIELAETDQPGLVAVAVTVSQNLPPERKPVQCTLVRWIPDPGLQSYDMATEAAAEALQNQQSASSGSTNVRGSTGGTPP